MKIITDRIGRDELTEMATKIFGSFVKAVVDVDRSIMAVDAELHADLEAELLQNGSKQINLWGINLHPAVEGKDWVEFDSMINLKPRQGNRTRGVEDSALQEKIIAVVQMRTKA